MKFEGVEPFQLKSEQQSSQYVEEGTDFGEMTRLTSYFMFTIKVYQNLYQRKQLWRDFIMQRPKVAFCLRKLKFIDRPQLTAKGSH